MQYRWWVGPVVVLASLALAPAEALGSCDSPMPTSGASFCLLGSGSQQDGDTWKTTSRVASVGATHAMPGTSVAGGTNIVEENVVSSPAGRIERSTTRVGVNGTAVFRTSVGLHAEFTQERREDDSDAGRVTGFSSGVLIEDPLLRALGARALFTQSDPDAGGCRESYGIEARVIADTFRLVPGSPCRVEAPWLSTSPSATMTDVLP